MGTGYPHKPTFPYAVTDEVRWEEKKQVTEKQALIDYLVTEEHRKGKVSDGVISEQRRKSREGDGWAINIHDENSSNAGDSKGNAECKCRNLALHKRQNTGMKRQEILCQFYTSGKHISIYLEFCQNEISLMCGGEISLGV